MNAKQVKINKVECELAHRMIKEHLGRWCEITLKKTGEVIKIVRTGYGPMEYPERDMQEIHVGDEVIECKNLHGVAKWICNRAYGWEVK